MFKLIWYAIDPKRKVSPSEKEDLRRVIQGFSVCFVMRLLRTGDLDMELRRLTNPDYVSNAVDYGVAVVSAEVYNYINEYDDRRWRLLGTRKVITHDVRVALGSVIRSEITTTLATLRDAYVASFPQDQEAYLGEQACERREPIEEPQRTTPADDPTALVTTPTGRRIVIRKGTNET